MYFKKSVVLNFSFQQNAEIKRMKKTEEEQDEGKGMMQKTEGNRRE
jgi:hypothetical protein